MEYIDDKNLDKDIADEIMDGSAKKEFLSAKEKADAEKYNAKENARREKERLKDEREKSRKKGGRGGYIAAIAALSFALLMIGAAFATVLLTPTASDVSLDASYRKSFYDTVAQVENMDLNMSKTLATKDKSAAQLYLTDLAVNSELAENDLQQLPLSDENKFYTTKIVNQVGDFAKYLNKKLVNGENLTRVDYENLNNLYKANRALKNALASAMENMGDDYKFADMGKDFEGNTLLKNFDELQELSVEYPELIYDGPFSDGKDGEVFKGITGEEITEAQAEEIFADLIAEYEPQNVRFVGKSTGAIESYGVQAEVKGEVIYGQVSVKGGKPLMFAYSGSCLAINYDETGATERAAEFLKRAGFADMKAVWINLENNVYTINFAPEIDGVIIYPDLVKARVCAETGMVIGLEATGYFKNHTEREIASPVLSQSAAREFVADEIAVETSRLAVVPVGNTTEKLCYEFYGRFNGDAYYVYIDAESGRQVEMFKVVRQGEGILLM